MKYSTGDSIIYTYTSYPPMSQPETEEIEATFLEYYKNVAIIYVNNRRKKVNFCDIRKINNTYSKDLL